MTVVAVIFTPIVLAYQAMDLLGVPQAAHRRAHPGRDRDEVKPFDPRIAPRLAPARLALAGAMGATVVNSVLVIGQAFALTALVVAVVEGRSLATGAAWLVAIVAVPRRRVAGSATSSRARGRDRRGRRPRRGPRRGARPRHAPSGRGTAPASSPRWRLAARPPSSRTSPATSRPRAGGRAAGADRRGHREQGPARGRDRGRRPCR